jgi:hypothetical protein
MPACRKRGWKTENESYGGHDVGRPKSTTPKPLPKAQHEVLAAMEAGTPLIAGQMQGAWINSNVLRALLNAQLVTVDPVTRVYQLTDLGRARLSLPQKASETYPPCSAAS